MSAAAAAAASSVERGDEETGAGADRCGRLYDNVTYWPLTSPGQLAVVACPPHFRGLPLTSGQSHGEMRRLGARVNVGSWQRRLEYQRSYSTSSPASTAMGDRLRAGIPSRYVTSQLGQLSLASLRGR